MNPSEFQRMASSFSSTSNPKFSNQNVARVLSRDAQVGPAKRSKDFETWDRDGDIDGYEEKNTSKPAPKRRKRKSKSARFTDPPKGSSSMKKANLGKVSSSTPVKQPTTMTSSASASREKVGSTKRVSSAAVSSAPPPHIKGTTPPQKGTYALAPSPKYIPHPKSKRSGRYLLMAVPEEDGDEAFRVFWCDTDIEVEVLDEFDLRDWGQVHDYLGVLEERKERNSGRGEEKERG